ncbi:MAG: insulinase family protein, partial [Anaerolineae bacterium]
MPDRIATPNPHDIFRRQLPNGITFLARHNPYSASLVLAGYMPIGSLCDPEGMEGLAEMTASLLMTGTQAHDEMQLYERLESVGAHFGYNNSTEMTLFGGQGLREDYDLLLETLAETLCTPAFPKKHLERMRVEWLAYLRERRYSAGEMVGLRVRQALYAGHPYHRDGNGSLESVQTIHRQAIQDFHNRWYAPQGCVIAVTGGIQPQEAFERLARTLEGWQNPEYQPRPRVPATAPLPADTAPQYLSIPDARQAVVAVSGTI